MEKKIFVFSDLHGSVRYLEEVLQKIEAEQPDKIVFLGDLNYNGARNPLPDGYLPKEVCRILKERNLAVTFVKGNCDSEVDETVMGKFVKNYSINRFGKRFLFTHGHKINAENPPRGAKKYDYVLHGHTHVNRFYEGETTYINISSVSLPKENSARSYAVITEDGIFVKDLESGLGLRSFKF